MILGILQIWKVITLDLVWCCVKEFFLPGTPSKITMNGVELKLPSSEEIKIFALPSIIKIVY